jgi:hypothetical protein
MEEVRRDLVEMLPFWIRLRALENVFGVSAVHIYMDGKEMSWFRRLREARNICR